MTSFNRKRLEHLERYSRDFNIRVLGVNEDEGEECMTKITDLVTSLGFQDATSEIENAHRTGKKRNDKPRPIIIRLYSRPFKRSLLQAAKSTDGKAILQGVRIVEDFTPSDFNGRKKALPFMKQAYDEGKKNLEICREMFASKMMVIKTSFPPPTEGLHHVQEKTEAFFHDKSYGVGTLYIASERLSWCDSSGQGFSLEYLPIPLLGICKDTTQFPHECIYCMIEEPLNDDENEGASDDSDVKVGEVRFVPEDKSALDVMFKALSECQLLQPDPQEQRTLMSSKIKRLEMENEELTKEAEEKLIEQVLRETKEMRASTSGMSQEKEQGMESTLQKRDETEAKQRRVGRPSATDTTAEELQQEITRLKEENKKLKLEHEKTAAHEQQKHSNEIKELTDKLRDAEFSRVALENAVSELTAKVAEARLDSQELKRSCRILERENKKLLADQEKLEEGWRILKRQNEKLQADKVLQRKKNQ